MKLPDACCPPGPAHCPQYLGHTATSGPPPKTGNSGDSANSVGPEK